MAKYATERKKAACFEDCLGTNMNAKLYRYTSDLKFGNGKTKYALYIYMLHVYMQQSRDL